MADKEQVITHVRAILNRRDEHFLFQLTCMRGFLSVYNGILVEKYLLAVYIKVDVCAKNMTCNKKCRLSENRKRRVLSLADGEKFVRFSDRPREICKREIQ